MTLNFTFNSEQVELKRKAQDIFRALEAKRPELREKILRKKQFPQEIWDALAQHQFMGALIPRKWGGIEGGLLPLTFAMEAMGGFGYGNMLPILTQMAAICLVRHGTAALQDKLLPLLAQGKLKCGVAATEAHSGLNVFNIKTFAENEGDHYRIDGAKYYISGADIVDGLLLIARTQLAEDCEEEGLPKTVGFSLYWLDPKTKGVTLEKIPTRGQPSLGQFALKLEKVRIPMENLIGPEDGGAFVLFDAMNVERILMGALSCGVTEHCLRQAVPYANGRKVFGDTPIGQYQAVQHPLAEIKIRQEALRLMIYKATWLFDQQKDLTDTGYYANCTKFLASELAMKAVDAAIEVMGGKGFHEDFDIIHLWEEVRLLKNAPLSNHMILNFIAERELKMPRSY